MFSNRHFIKKMIINIKGIDRNIDEKLYVPLLWENFGLEKTYLTNEPSLNTAGKKVKNIFY